MEQPLVSVTVITYNSSKTVLETLESIKAQTYQNIELIVSDDCSTDDTVELCRNWIEQNKDRFVRAELLTVEKNTGVAGNCNRAGVACQGEWVKCIAGDDILMPNCVSHNLQYTYSHPSAKYIFSRVEPFGVNPSVVKLYEDNNIFDYTIFDKSTEQQLESFIYDDAHIPAPSLFYNRAYDKDIEIINDERLPLVEDEPKWINLLKAGVHLYFLDEVTVKYRVGDADALSSPTHVMSPKQFESICRFFFYYKFPARYERNQEQAIEKMIELIMWNYQMAYESASGKIFTYPKSYRMFMKVVKPLKNIKHWIRRKIYKK